MRYDDGMEPLPRPGWREAGLVLLLAAPLAWLMLVHGAPIPQDPAFHLFADTRTCLGIVNFGNVASNAAFLAVGLVGVLGCLRRPGAASAAWTVFFLGVALVAPGSAWYHHAPNDASLVWDRLPMTVAFMALFVALLGEHFGPAWERRLLVPALIAGIASVVVWKATGDLRFYIWVQAAPFLAVVYLLAAYPGRHSHRHYLLYGAGCYALAKIAEFHDHEIYALTAMLVSGHTLKHLLAATAPLCVYLMIRRRRPAA